jgi:hypothetical protein
MKCSPVQAGQMALILVFGNISIVIQLVLDVEDGRRAPENEMSHRSGYDGPANQIMI